jgi:hypothetical protein
MIRRLVALAVALLIGFGIALGGGRSTVVRGAEPTPTPLQTNGQPGGGGGGGP